MNKKSGREKDEALRESFAEIKKAARELSGEKAEKLPEKAEKKPSEKTPEKKSGAKKSTAGKTAAKAEKEKSAEKAEKSAPKVKLCFEFFGRKIDEEDVRKRAMQAAAKVKPGAKRVEIYIVAAQNAAYFVVDGVGSADYRIEL